MPAFNDCPSLTKDSKAGVAISTVSIPIWTSTSIPSSVCSPIACLLGKTLRTFPEIGATTSPSRGLTANPSPIIFCEKTGSLTCAIGITSPVATATKSFFLPKKFVVGAPAVLSAITGSGMSTPEASKSSISDFKTSAFGP